MFRFMSRSAAVAVVAALFLLIAVPAVQARSFDRSGPSVEAGAGWVDAALSWLTNLLFGATPSAPEKPAVAASTLIPFGGGYQPQSGSCIDPEGRPRPSCY